MSNYKEILTQEDEKRILDETEAKMSSVFNGKDVFDRFMNWTTEYIKNKCPNFTESTISIDDFLNAMDPLSASADMASKKLPNFQFPPCTKKIIFELVENRIHNLACTVKETLLGCRRDGLLKDTISI